jgi:hypothetical protein
VRFTYLRCVEDIKVNYPAHRSGEQWKHLIEIAQVLRDGGPTWEDSSADDGPKNNLRKWNEALHKRIKHAEAPDWKESHNTRLAERVVSDTQTDGDPCDECGNGLGEGEHARWQRADFASFHMDVKITIAYIAKDRCEIRMEHFQHTDFPSYYLLEGAKSTVSGGYARPDAEQDLAEGENIQRHIPRSSGETSTPN